MKAGVFASEFWLSLLAVLMPVGLLVLDHVYAIAQSGLHLTVETFVGGLVAAVYTYVRGWLKKHVLPPAS